MCVHSYRTCSLQAHIARFDESGRGGGRGGPGVGEGWGLQHGRAQSSTGGWLGGEFGGPVVERRRQRMMMRMRMMRGHNFQVLLVRNSFSIGEVFHMSCPILRQEYVD